MLKVLLAVSDGRGEDAAELVIRMSEKSEAFDPAEFRRKIARFVSLHRDQDLKQLNVGQSLVDVSRHAHENGLFVPSELTLLGKTLLQLDDVGRILDPQFDPNASVRRNIGKLLPLRLRKNLTRGNFFSTLLEMKDFTTQFPSRLNRIMDSITNSEFELKVKSVDARMVVDGMQKIANRITSGLVLAALIMGAALLMRVETSFHLFGYPGIAILCFLAAAAGGFWLVITIFIHDHKSRKKFPKP